ncbi:MAG: sigma-54-dependent Fis family transcriptional regulator [Rhodospirillales bacterium]|nr:sigma-54-dependent Fis family transcriptional regulator [Rhodospirillales bacterium]
MLTRQMLADLGADYLARLLLKRAPADPGLLEELRGAALARRPADKFGNGRMAAWPAIAVGPRMVGSSPAMQRVHGAVRKIAASAAPVLITGESGTGKELAALAIHQGSARAAGPFVPINCAALPPALIAAELFGHERGSFTGANQKRAGRIQSAEGGTVFLDEIGDLPLDLQAHLLRFLQENTIDRVGGHHPIKVDVRVVAATNAPLRRAVASGAFREDLYYRLNVLTLEMPPLRERGGDIDELAKHFLIRFSQEMNRPDRALSTDALTAIRAYSWPGNVRELAAALRRAVVMADGEKIEVADLDLPADGIHERNEDTVIRSLEDARQQAELTLLRQALRANRSNVKRTAEQLGISRVTLYRLLEKHQISPREDAAL